MPMSKAVEDKIAELDYNGTPDEQYNALVSVLRTGIKTPTLIDSILERLTPEDMEELIQIEHC